jgi:LuxR family maltose regulon positive regulatory protein
MTEAASDGVRRSRAGCGAPASLRPARALGRPRRRAQSGRVAVVEPLIRVAEASPSSPVAPPAARQAVVRTPLLRRLCAASDLSVATIVAPAGYGKTTLLSQWAERDPRMVLWVALEPEDDDADIVESRLAAVEEEPGLLVLVDDVHVLRSREALDMLGRLLDRAAPGTTVALAARRAPALPLARLRAQGRLLEIGADELALTGRDAEALLRRAGVLLPRRDALALAERVEGWPAALFLAALSLRSGTPAAAVAGDDRFLADYLESEHLAGLSSSQRRFAAQTSMLDELTSAACDSLLDRSDSGRMLESLESAGVVVPLDHRRRRYRYPRVVRDLLRAELERSEPERARDLHRAAAACAAENGSTEEALDHAAAAGDLDRVAELATQLAVDACGRGRLDLIARWLDLLRDESVVESHPDLCIAASWLYALRGRAGDAQHWADAATRGLGGDDPRLRVLQGLRCRDGADQMLDDTTIACRALAAGHTWRPAAVLAHGVSLLLAGDVPRAKHDLVEAVELASAAGASELRIVGLCVHALLAIAEDAQADADAFAAEAAAVAALDPPASSLVALLLEAVRARNAARHCEHGEASAGLERAERLLPHATHAVPWLATLALLELVHVRLALAAPDGARALLRQVADIFRVRPRLGVLVQRNAELDRRTRALAEPDGRWASSLTPAESRLVPLLATHLSFREIGERLYVSRNTVKTQAMAVYRKFGVTSRSAAIARAVALGLIDETAIVPHGAFRCAE